MGRWHPGPVDVVKLAQECGVADKVVVFGSVADQGLRYLLSTATSLPAVEDRPSRRQRGLPVALIEAMSYGNRSFHAAGGHPGASRGHPH